MTVFHSAVEMAAKFERVARDMHQLPEKLVKQAGDIVADEIKQQARGIRIPRSKPAKLGAKVDLQSRFGAANARAVVTPTPRGLWTILEEGANSHVIVSKYVGGSRASRQKRFLGGDVFEGFPRAVLNIPGIGYRRYALIPKTRGGGKGTWEGGIRNAFGPVRAATGIDIANVVEG